MKKVLHIIDSWGLGGAQAIVRGIFEAQKLNKDIYLYILRKRKINFKINHSNVKLFNSEARYSFRPINELRKLIEGKNIEVLHCHLFRSQVFGYILKKRYFSKIKLIFHEHGEVFQNHKVYNYFMKQSQKEVDKIIAVSKSTKQELINKANINPKKIIILYNFVDLKKFNKKNIKRNIKKDKKKMGIKENDFVIGFAGRLAGVKGCKYLIKALPNLDFSYKCVIAGDGPLKEDLIKLSRKLEVYDKVIFLGYQSDILKFYSLIDVLVMPSLSESFGLSIVEAQASSIPVIASNISGINEIIQNKKNGLLFEARNSNDLAKKIETIYSKKSLGEMLIKEGLTNAKKYPLNKYLAGLNNIYNDIYHD